MPKPTGQRVPPTTHGPVNQVPCPHCGKPNDLRDLDSQQLLDTGHEIVCGPLDGQLPIGHCGRVFQVAGIRMVKVIYVRSSDAQPRRLAQPSEAARTIGAGMLRRLLK